MRIEFTRTGGFAGIRVHAVLDSDALPEGERHSLESLVEDAGFFALPGRLGASKPDAFEYEVAIDRGDGSHRVRIGGGAHPPALQTLLTRLTEAARRTRG